MFFLLLLIKMLVEMPVATFVKKIFSNIHSIITPYIEAFLCIILCVYVFSLVVHCVCYCAALKIHPVICRFGTERRGLTAYVLTQEEMIKRHYPVKGASLSLFFPPSVLLPLSLIVPSSLPFYLFLMAQECRALRNLFAQIVMIWSLTVALCTDLTVKWWDALLSLCCV